MYVGVELTMAGGNDAAKTSIYDPATSVWTAESEMNLGRGYQSVSCNLPALCCWLLIPLECANPVASLSEAVLKVSLDSENRYANVDL